MLKPAFLFLLPSSFCLLPSSYCAAQDVAITDLVTEGSGRDLILRWTVPDQGLGGPAMPPLAYQVRSSTAGPITNDNWNYATYLSVDPNPFREGAPIPGAYEFATLPPLDADPSVVYHFSIRCLSIWTFDWGGVSNDATGSYDAIPPAPIADLAVIGVTNGRLLLQWTATGDDGGAGQASHFDLRYVAEPSGPVASWMNALQAVLPASPAPAGTVQSAEVQLPFSTGRVALALAVGDDRSNWSAYSNSVEARFPTASVVHEGGSGKSSGGCGGSAAGQVALIAFAALLQCSRLGLSSSRTFSACGRKG